MNVFDWCDTQHARLQAALDRKEAALDAREWLQSIVWSRLIEVGRN